MANATELLFQSAGDLALLIRARKVSPVDIVRAALDRIEAANPKVSAFITVTGERALAQARAAEREIAAGKHRGPLHGIPYAVKDLVATKGVRTTNGSRVTANWVPDYDAEVVTRLDGAGAILVGKLNLLEFAMGSGQVGLDGRPARNPWDLRYSPSGSSSGSGAAIASGMVPLTMGTDSGGSIRGPAKSCGVVGLKPTQGLVSVAGVTTLSWTLDHVGPMARTVGDVAWMLGAMTGARSGGALGSVGLKGVRIGVPRAPFWEHVQSETGAALERALGVLKDLGAVVVEGVSVRHADVASAISAVILGAESASFHQKKLKAGDAELLDPLVRERLEAGLLYSAVDYIKALRIRTVLVDEMRRVFESCDALMLPAGNAAPKLEDEIVGTDAPPAVPRAPRPDVFNLANVTGIPSLVLPCGFTAGAPVLPLGMQFCARPGAEATLFRIGGAYQSVTDWHRRKPPEI